MASSETDGIDLPESSPRSPGSDAGPRSADEVRAAGLYMTRSAARFSAALVAIVCSGYGALSFVGVLQTLGVTEAVVSAVYTLGILAIQLGYLSRPRGRLTPVRSAVALVVMAALVYLPLLHLGSTWSAFTGFMAAGLLIAMPTGWGVTGFLAVVASSSLLERRFGAGELQPTFEVAYAISSSAITGLVIFGLTRLARLVSELHDAREELSRMAVAEERLRFSRDAHDLLGMSLSAITLKAELAHRLLAAEPERAGDEIVEVLTVSRRALGEVRMVASGAMSLSLADELASARSVLAAAEIETAVREPQSDLPDDIATLLATLLREAVTNVLRHSKADVCSIAVSREGGTARISIVNDRADEKGELPDDRPDGSHRGISNLRQRFADRGGSVTVRRDGGEFIVVATLPVTG